MVTQYLCFVRGFFYIRGVSRISTCLFSIYSYVCHCSCSVFLIGIATNFGIWNSGTERCTFLDFTVVFSFARNIASGSPTFHRYLSRPLVPARTLGNRKEILDMMNFSSRVTKIQTSIDTPVPFCWGLFSCSLSSRSALVRSLLWSGPYKTLTLGTWCRLYKKSTMNCLKEDVIVANLSTSFLLLQIGYHCPILLFLADTNYGRLHFFQNFLYFRLGIVDLVWWN